MYVLFELCNLKHADQFTQILSLTAHLLTGSRTFLGCCGIRLYNVIDLLDSFIDLMDCCCLRLLCIRNISNLLCDRAGIIGYVF